MSPLKIWLGVEGFCHQSCAKITIKLVVPAWTAGTQIDMDVSGRILRAWMPAIHAGMTEAADGKNLRRTLAVAWRKIPPFSSSAGECKLMTHSLDYVSSGNCFARGFYFSVNGDLERKRSTGFFSVSSI